MSLSTQESLEVSMPMMLSFGRLLRALPKELHEEFYELGSWMATLPDLYPGVDGEFSYNPDLLTPEERIRDKRYAELTDMATDIVRSSRPAPAQQPQSKGLVSGLSTRAMQSIE